MNRDPNLPNKVFPEPMQGGSFRVARTITSDSSTIWTVADTTTGTIVAWCRSENLARAFVWAVEVHEYLANRCQVECADFRPCGRHAPNCPAADLDIS